MKTLIALMLTMASSAALAHDWVPVAYSASEHHDSYDGQVAWLDHSGLFSIDRKNIKVLRGFKAAWIRTSHMSIGDPQTRIATSPLWSRKRRGIGN